MKKNFTYLAILIFSTCCSLSAQYTNPLTLQFNSSFITNAGLNDGNVYISISSGAQVNFVNSIAAGTNINWTGGNLYSDPVSLAQLSSGGGLSFTNGSSTIFYITYGSPLGSLTTAPSPVATNDLSYNTPWQAFEITKTTNSNNAGDVGDLTYINEFSAKLAITSYDSNNVMIQTSGFGVNSTAQIFNSLAQLTGNNPTAVLTNSSGQYTRIVAPVSYSDLVGPYDNFNKYITALASNSVQTTLQNASGFLVSNNAANNINFTFTLTNSYTTNGYIIASGNVLASNTVSQIVTTNITGLTILYSNTPTQIGSAIYGANYTTASNTISFVDSSNNSTAAQWTAMSNYMVATYGTNSTNNYTTGSNAYYTVLSQMVGEISATIESGLAGSTNIVNNNGVSGILGTNLSSQWWTMTNPLPIMSSAQTNSYYYDQYGNVIFTNSADSVYNFSYNDRYNNAKPVVFANYYQGTNVSKWVIDVGTPVSQVSLVPETSTSCLLGIGSLAMLIALMRRRRS